MRRMKREYLGIKLKDKTGKMLVETYRCPKYTTLSFDLILSEMDINSRGSVKINKIIQDYILPRYNQYKKLSPWYLMGEHGGAFASVKVLTKDANSIRKQILTVLFDEDNLRMFNEKTSH